MILQNKTGFKLLIILITGLLLTKISGCDGLSIQKSITESYQLTDQHNERVQFPETFSGNVMLVGYVYTQCPDICPLITYNMRDVQRELEAEEDFMLVSLSFDPERDTPEVLYDYANNYRLDQSNWRLLTGNSGIVESALETLEIRTLKTPTRFDQDGKPIYFIDHTDKVTLIDRQGNIRNTYTGSDMDTERIVADIHKLLAKE